MSLQVPFAAACFAAFGAAWGIRTPLCSLCFSAPTRRPSAVAGGCETSCAHAEVAVETKEAGDSVLRGGVRRCWCDLRWVPV